MSTSVEVASIEFSPDFSRADRMDFRAEMKKSNPLAGKGSGKRRVRNGNSSGQFKKKLLEMK